MLSSKLLPFITILLCVSFFIEGTEADKEDSGYVTVRQDANMFWWLLYANSSDNRLIDYRSYPLIIWLQGGPGGSSTGFGNFNEIGPLDVNLKERNTSWIRYANLLFIDNPVGTGYSYVSNSNAYSKNNKQIAKDLVQLLKAFMQKLPDFQTIPLYIFSESYGGKMTTSFAVELHHSIQNNEIRCNLQGIALGDSWISPVDSVASWGPYLYSLSFIDANEQQKIEANAEAIRTALRNGQYVSATNLWSDTETLVEELTDGINFYNVLQRDTQQSKKTSIFYNSLTPDLRQNERAVKKMGQFYQDDLYTLMNGPIKQKLHIPSNVVWGGQSSQVFTELEGDFMLPVVDQIDYLLNNTQIQVIVYTGQLDLIVDTIGTLNWINSLKWSDLKYFKSSSKNTIEDSYGEAAAFYKTYKNFSLYWILKAGHMVPSDAGDTALQMVQKILNPKKIHL
jgi:serine carboxypeptidase 1